MGIFKKKASANATAPENVESQAPTEVPSPAVSVTKAEDEKGPTPVEGEKSPDSSSVSSLEKKDGLPLETEALPVTTEAVPPKESTIENSTTEDEKHLAEDETKEAKPEGEDEIEYPSGVKLFVISIALCLSVFLVALDNTIIATAIPKITDRFNSLGDVGWYGSAYLLTTCALQLFFGKSVTLFLSMSTTDQDLECIHSTPSRPSTSFPSSSSR